MDQKILWAVNKMPKTDDKNLPIMGLEEIKKARTFHESFPQYTETVRLILYIYFLDS